MSRWNGEIEADFWMPLEACIYPKPSLRKMVQRKPKFFRVMSKDLGYLRGHISGHLSCFWFPKDKELLVLWRHPSVPTGPLPMLSPLPQMLFILPIVWLTPTCPLRPSFAMTSSGTRVFPATKAYPQCWDGCSPTPRPCFYNFLYLSITVVH